MCGWVGGVSEAKGKERGQGGGSEGRGGSGGGVGSRGEVEGRDILLGTFAPGCRH